MHGIVETKTICSVDSLSLSTNEGPFISFIDLEIRDLTTFITGTYLCLLICMLQIRDNNQHKAVERERNDVVLEVNREIASRNEKSYLNHTDRRITNMKTNVSSSETHDSTENTLYALLVVLEETRVRPEVGTVGISEDSVNRDPPETKSMTDGSLGNST